MTILIHTATAMVIGQYTGNPILAFIGGIISHIFLDLIPHGDNNAYQRYKRKELSAKKAMAMMVLDAIASIIFVLIFFNLDISRSNFVTSAAILGGILPDILIGFHELLEPRIPKWLKVIHKWHFLNHDLIAQKYDISRKNGIIMQILFFFILLKIL